jgi:hypothetical protein
MSAPRKSPRLRWHSKTYLIATALRTCLSETMDVLQSKLFLADREAGLPDPGYSRTSAAEDVRRLLDLAALCEIDDVGDLFGPEWIVTRQDGTKVDLGVEARALVAEIGGAA